MFILLLVELYILDYNQNPWAIFLGGIKVEEIKKIIYDKEPMLSNFFFISA